MEQKGYITRIVSTHNNMMIKRTSLTEQGKKLYDETNEAFRQLGKRVLAEFSDSEIEEFIYLLEKLQEKMLQNSKIKF